MKNKDLVKPESIFDFRGNKYRCFSICFEPSIEMINIKTNEKFSFGITAPIRSEFKLIK